MNKSICMVLALAAAAVSQAAEDKTFVLTSIDGVDAALTERIRTHLEESSGVVVRAAPPLAAEPGQTLEALGRAAARTLGENDHSVVVLARPGADQPQGVCLPRERFGILNLDRLEANDPGGKFERRVGQDALRVMSMLLDMSPCPFPLCLLVGYEKTEDLDQMSGNFCPPCQERFARLAREAGLRFVETPEAEAEAAPAAEPVPAEEPAPAAAE
ncbi:MAG: hypothetical protein AB7V14_02490 [Kiritimatiellia bacterium]